MNTLVRVVVTLLALPVAMLMLGLLSIAYESSGTPRGAIYSLLAVAILGGVPWLAWWVTGRIRSQPRS